MPQSASSSPSETARTVAVAVLADLVVAGAKLVAGILTRSSAMLAESAHGLADCANGLMLTLSIRRSRRPADERHPFGHSREQFVGAFIAAVSSFIVGGCVSIALAIEELIHRPRGGTSLTVGFVVLAVAFAADAVSLRRGLSQASDEARQRRISLVRQVYRTSDPALRAVVVEDSLALIGDLLAALGLLLRDTTGSDVPDAVAALLIGVMLATSAVVLGHLLSDLLIGRGLNADRVARIHQLLLDSPSVASVVSLRAIYTGPDHVLVAARIRPQDGVTGAQLAHDLSALDHQMHALSPVIADVYIDVTDHGEETIPSASRPSASGT